MKTTLYEVITQSPAAQIQAIRVGFPAVEIATMRDTLGVPMSELYGILGMPERTAIRLAKEGRRLDSAASERLLRLVETMGHAEEAFGSRTKGIEWLTKHNRELKSKPIDLLDTQIGHDQVSRILLAIEHGLPV